MPRVPITQPQILLDAASSGRVFRPGFPGLFPSGIVVGFVPGGESFDTEIWCAPESTGVVGSPGSSAGFQLARLGPGSYTYQHNLPLSTTRYFYQARHVNQNYLAGAFSTWVSSLPVILYPDLRQQSLAPPGIEFDDAGNVYVKPGLNIIPGSVQGSTAVVKKLRIPYTAFIPADNTQQFVFSGGIGGNYLRPSTAASIGMVAPIPLPKGVTVTQIDFRLYRGSTADTASGSFTKLLEGAISLGPVLDHSTTGWATVSSTAGGLPFTIGDDQWGLSVTLASSSAAGANARANFVEITYQMPNYAAGY